MTRRITSRRDWKLNKADWKILLVRGWKPEEELVGLTMQSWFGEGRLFIHICQTHSLPFDGAAHVTGHKLPLMNIIVSHAARHYIVMPD